MATSSTARAVEPRILSAVFKNREDADAAYKSLLKNGYNSGDIHLLMSEETRGKYYCDNLPSQPGTTEEDTLAGLERGAIFGGGLGAVMGALAGVGASVIIPGMGFVVAGPLAASLAGAGGMLGGALGALFGSSLPEEEARRFEKAIREGSIQIGVRPRDPESATQIENEWRSLGADIVCN